MTFDYFEPEELRDIRDIISDYAKIENDVHLAGNGRAIDVYFETLDESKKSARKSLSESLTEENKEVVRARINLDGNENLMDLFAEEEIYDSTKYDYSYEELAKAIKKLFGKVGKDFDWDFTNKNTIIVTTKKIR